MAPFFISLIIIVVGSLAVTTLLNRTSVAEYVMYINMFLAVTVGPAVYTRLKKVVDLYLRPHPNPYTYSE
jgi:hypothetical protein